METLRLEFRGKKAKSIIRNASRLYGGPTRENVYRAVNEAVDDWLTRMPRRKKTIDASELTGAASGIKMSSLEAEEKALELFGSAD